MYRIDKSNNLINIIENEYSITDFYVKLEIPYIILKIILDNEEYNIHLRKIWYDFNIWSSYYCCDDLIKLEREDENSIKFQIYFIPTPEKTYNKLQIFVNEEKIFETNKLQYFYEDEFSKTPVYIMTHKFFKSKFLKIYFEIDDSTTNILEQKENPYEDFQTGYLIGTAQINSLIIEEINLTQEVFEKTNTGFYISFEDEKRNKFLIETFLIIFDLNLNNFNDLKNYYEK